MTEQMHIIDNKKVLITDDEWRLYQEICKSLDDPPAFQGKQFFQNLFKSNDQGMIQFLRPPVNTCTFEVFLFMVSIMVHQRLREAAKVVGEMKVATESRIGEAARTMNDRIAALEKRIAELEGKTK